jgi:CheY-like chemotaxis protein
MQMPETPMTPDETDMRKAMANRGTHSSRDGSPTKHPMSLPSPINNKRERADEIYFHPGPPLKKMFMMNETEILQTYYSVDATGTSAAGPSIAMTEKSFPPRISIESDSQPERTTADKKSGLILEPEMMSPIHRRVITRDFMRSLVNDALRSGHPTNEVHTETQLGEMIEVRTVGPRGETQDRTVYLEIEPDVPEAIITEEQHLQFSLQKLVDNAIKFTESGSITIAVKLGRSSQVVEIWVVDTGCGIAEESKSSLFKPHFQEDASVTRLRDGLGLSLFNAKAHVRKNLGGEMTLERSATEGPSKGSEFLIRLPITSLDSSSINTPLVGTPPPSAQPCRPSPWSDTSTSSNHVSYESTATTQSRTSPPKPSPRKTAAFNPLLAQDYPLNILIAEDNVINRNVAVGSLSKLGYSNEKVTIAFDGVEAVLHYKASLSKPPKERFNAILMDIWMPNMDGYEATRKIMELAKENGESTTIIAVTADITGDCVMRAKAAGMQGFLSKPYKVLDIENLIVENFPKA